MPRRARRSSLAYSHSSPPQASAAGNPPRRGSQISGEISKISACACYACYARRCRLLKAQRDEARADAYAARSEALQRGVELDNLGGCCILFYFIFGGGGGGEGIYTGWGLHF